MLTIAHRGASGYAPENTFAAFDVAVRMDADYLELDIRATADGALVALHDESLDRTTWGTAAHCRGPVSAKTLAELDACEVGSWFDARFEGERIPTVEEVLDRYARRIGLCLELKPPAGPHVATALLDAIRRHHARGHVMIQSFDAGLLQALHALDPGLGLVQLCRTPAPAAVRAVLPHAAGYAQAIGVQLDTLDAFTVAAARARGLAIHVQTVNHVADVERVLSLGVDAVVTDYPDRVVRARRGPQTLQRAA